MTDEPTFLYVADKNNKSITRYSLILKYFSILPKFKSLKFQPQYFWKYSNILIKQFFNVNIPNY